MQGVVWAGRMLALPPGKSAGNASENENEKKKNGGGEKGAARRANRCVHVNRNRDKSINVFFTRNYVVYGAALRLHEKQVVAVPGLWFSARCYIETQD
jgi:hypothetical protein